MAFQLFPYQLIGLGAVAGLFNGLLGIGGGWFLVPALHWAGMPLPTAVGTTLTQIAGGTTMGVWRHHQRGNVNFRLGAFFGICMMAGSRLGQLLVIKADDQGFSRWMIGSVYCLVLGFVSFSMLMNVRRDLRSAKLQVPSRVRQFLEYLQFGPRIEFPLLGHPIAIFPLGILALCVGMIAAVTGLGGGFFMVPMLLTLGLSMAQSIGTSLLGVCMGSFAGSFSYHLAGRADLKAGFFLVLGALGGSYLGVSLASRIHPVKLKIIFACMALTACAAMLFRMISGVT